MRNKWIDEMLEKAGKDSGGFKRSLMMSTSYEGNSSENNGKSADLRKRGIAAGSSAEIIDFLQEYEDAGCQQVMLQWLDLDNMDALAQMGTDLLKEFRR
jgi:hypothetical protein